MPLPAVVVEAPQELAPENARVLVEACSKSVTRGQCILGAGGERETPRAVVLVTAREDGLEVLLQLGIRSETGTRWTRRSLSFDAADPEAERWRSVGLVIGTLVSKEEEEQKAAIAQREARREPKPEPRPTATPALPPPASESEATSQFALEVRALGGRGLDDGTPRWGVELGAAVRVWSAPAWLGIAARQQWSGRDADGVQVRWSSLSGGLRYGVSLTQAWTAEVEAHGVGERVAADVSNEPQDSGARWVFRARGRAGVALAVGGSLTLLAGAELDAGEGTRILLGGVPRARIPDLTWGAAVGGRWSW